MIYFDTCALLKLIRADAQSGPLGAFIDARPATRWFTAALLAVALASALSLRPVRQRGGPARRPPARRATG